MGINADDLSGVVCAFIGVAPGDYGMNADDDELFSANGTIHVDPLSTHRVFPELVPA